MLAISSVHAETVTDDALWAGAIALNEREHGLDYSLEYQLRLSEDLGSYSSQFFEAMGYQKTANNVLLYGGYRFTKRPDHNENRILIGAFWDLTKNDLAVWQDPDRFKAVLQIGYQRDFNVEFEDQLMQSNSIRWILVGSKPVTEKLTPFFLAGVLTTWNDAFNFGVDKTRLGGGIVWRINKWSRLRGQYVFERAYYLSPQKNTNIIWLRYEMKFGD
jgi:hypothetical protein